jgi:8-oxo-dGTP diphosphatase
MEHGSKDIPGIKRIQRYGAYGVILHDGRILLTQKKSGPYKDRWGLPGGAIEFGETPEDTLKRELLEETALSPGLLNILTTATFNGEYDQKGEKHKFHHVGIIFRVGDWSERPDLKPEEEGRWFTLKGIELEQLTPFAKHILPFVNIPLAHN